MADAIAFRRDVSTAFPQRRAGGNGARGGEKNEVMVEERPLPDEECRRGKSPEPEREEARLSPACDPHERSRHHEPRPGRAWSKEASNPLGVQPRSLIPRSGVESHCVVVERTQVTCMQRAEDERHRHEPACDRGQRTS